MVETAVAAKAAVERVAAVPAAERAAVERAAVARVAAMGAGGRWRLGWWRWRRGRRCWRRRRRWRRWRRRWRIGGRVHENLCKVEHSQRR